MLGRNKYYIVAALPRRAPRFASKASRPFCSRLSHLSAQTIHWRCPQSSTGDWYT